ncbi:MAG TPA: hypothetical protein VL490_06605, partial [Mucilaginibacter sp.]|nr:hypothetical protein [Mucilaginibacter sp.]
MKHLKKNSRRRRKKKRKINKYLSLPFQEGIFFAMKIRFFVFALISCLAFQSCQQKKDVSATVVKKQVVITQQKTITQSSDSICVAAVGDIMMGTSYPNSITLPADSGK